MSLFLAPLTFNFEVWWFKLVDRSTSAAAVFYGFYSSDLLYLVAGIVGLTASLMNALTWLQKLCRRVLDRVIREE